MVELIAACGLDCEKCPAYVAAKTDDGALRVKTLGEWSKAFGFVGTSDMINCHGCFAKDGVQIGHCAECGIRLCAMSKGEVNCAACPEYGNCEQLAAFLVHAPEAKKNLEEARR